MPIKAIPGLNRLALPEARLVERSIFNGLSPSKMAGHPAPHGKHRLISVSLRVRFAVSDAPTAEPNLSVAASSLTKIKPLGAESI
jgi:hypothetical protein